MCGLVGAITPSVKDFLISGLKTLQYRGYDSFGAATYSDDSKFHVVRQVGGVPEDLTKRNLPGNIGIAHNRWATHGKVSVENTHPIVGGYRDITTYVAHNGIIENYRELRQDLEYKGYLFKTETDTEVIAHLLDWHLPDYLHYADIGKALLRIKEQLKGQYAFIALIQNFEGIVAVANGSPLVFSSFGVASDPQVFAGYTDKYTRLPDGVAAIIGMFPKLVKTSWLEPSTKKSELGILFFTDTTTYQPVFDEPVPRKQEISTADHAMIQEIREQPQLLMGAPLCSTPIPPACKMPPRPERVTLFGCGSSYYAAQVGRFYLQQLAGIPTQVEYSTELTCGQHFPAGQLYIALTQSGETKDTLNAMQRLPRDQILCLTNSAHSQAARLANNTWLLECGVERGVAATKTFTKQIALLLRLAVDYSGLDTSLLRDLETIIPAEMEGILQRESGLMSLARIIDSYDHLLLLSRGILYPIAQEGALKFKEVSYVHGEAIHSTEVKHGPLALIDNKTLCLFLVQNGAYLDKVISNMAEIHARGGRIIAVADSISEKDVSVYAWEMFMLPAVNEFLQPFITVLVLQLLAFYLAVLRGHNPDFPKNLAKSCTTE